MGGTTESFRFLHRSARALCHWLCLILLCQVLEAGIERPNILFILTEDQGAHMSLLGTPGLSTPNMDHIAKGGVFFNRAYVNYPVCSPSKAGIYTGTHCVTNGLRGVTTNWHGPEDTMPEGIANHRLTKLNRIRDDGEGMQERCVYDGRWKLIYRENRAEPRQVNADLKYFHHPNPKAPYQGNRVYDEITSRREEFPEAFRLLALIDNGALMPGEALPMFELYDLDEDPWELNDLAGNPAHRNELKRLLKRLQRWSVETDDTYTVLKSISPDTDTLLRQLTAE